MKQLGSAVKIFLFFTVVTGLIYPLLIAGLSQIFFARQMGGELLSRNGKIIGARLIGQKFISEKYFWGRPSSIDYNPIPSGGSNLGPTSEVLRKAVKDRAILIRKVHAISENDLIPPDLLFASGSGLDPEISPAAAYFQVDRIAKVRGIGDRQKLVQLIKQHIQSADLGFIGDPRVNVLELNLALDEATFGG